MKQTIADTAPNAEVIFAGKPRDVDVDVVIPVYNEQKELGSSIMLLVDRLERICRHVFPISWEIVIADNASTDQTWEVAGALVQRMTGIVRALRIPTQGRGRAIRLAWTNSHARALAYMDVDLSTDIRQIPELICPILEGAADVSFGSRLMPTSKVHRCLRREFISRAYNLMLRIYLGVGFRDAQCGFKAVSADAARALVPLVDDNEWFFDTELLVIAEQLGVATHEFPVRWREDPSSSVRVLDAARKDIAGMRRLKRSNADRHPRTRSVVAGGAEKLNRSADALPDGSDQINGHRADVS